MKLLFVELPSERMHQFYAIIETKKIHTKRKIENIILVLNKILNNKVDLQVLLSRNSLYVHITSKRLFLMQYRN